MYEAGCCAAFAAHVTKTAEQYCSAVVAILDTLLILSLCESKQLLYNTLKPAEKGAYFNRP